MEHIDRLEELTFQEDLTHFCTRFALMCVGPFLFDGIKHRRHCYHMLCWWIWHQSRTCGEAKACREWGYWLCRGGYDVFRFVIDSERLKGWTSRRWWTWLVILRLQAAWHDTTSTLSVSKFKVKTNEDSQDTSDETLWRKWWNADRESGGRDRKTIKLIVHSHGCLLENIPSMDYNVGELDVGWVVSMTICQRRLVKTHNIPTVLAVFNRGTYHFARQKWSSSTAAIGGEARKLGLVQGKYWRNQLAQECQAMSCSSLDGAVHAMQQESLSIGIPER
jgi:hypothetical protein